MDSQTNAQETRKQKQRRENPARAVKMHLARIAYEAENQLGLESPNYTFPYLNIGCSGWFYWDWKEKFYPAEMPTSQWFEYYANQFHTVELNAPFYSWPTIATVKSWIKQAKDQNIIYTVKVNELITHSKRFEDTATLIKDFYFISELLGPLLGCFLFQMPPSYRYNKSRLKNILSQLDHTKRNVIEFRHNSWWNEEVFVAFRETGTIFCSCSGPQLPDELVKTADDIYIRFHGTIKWYRHDYSKKDLKKWAHRIQASGAKRVWVYFNNDYDAFAIKNARELEKELE
jgi:uncharacterized protein YecE (DUF72 family)